MTLLDFFAVYAGETVIFTGSTALRTSVYKRAILRYNVEFSEYLIITGLDAEGNEQSVQAGMDYVAFLIRYK